MNCPKCGSADFIPPDEGAWGSCNDCGYVDYDEWTIQIQNEVRLEQAMCKRVLGYVPEYSEARKKVLAK